MRNHEPILGSLEFDDVNLSQAGRVVWDVWLSLPGRYPGIEIGTAVVMPDHFHGILLINNLPAVGAIHDNTLAV